MSDTTTQPEPYYGEAPHDLGEFDLTDKWHEFMHYLYLPVRIPLSDVVSAPEHIRKATGPWFRNPDRLWFLDGMIGEAVRDAQRLDPERFADPYVYVTARRGFATPGNPLNRPGWHCDDFGGHDLNYVWTDAFPTRYLTSSTPLAISEDDAQSMADMEALAATANTGPGSPWLEDGWPLQHLLRLSPYVVHDTPIIPAPGGMRSFAKVSISTHRYNLKGNSHNYLLDYRWPLYSREALRNQPGARADRDYVRDEEVGDVMRRSGWRSLGYVDETGV